ncbi:Cas10/Cmr2 second palm domain-containing protein [Acanthopleuribacter pedis]|uniref:Cas10/Cmr2 second palm domain-containing protein n=1 Tax=Acanthopleuribacter pedis TaxID=442870 RepID=A0A8J7QL93_9BACT|nr:hypothetical protein [Acanthopleuribacter pedis]MBO1321965.1 hypothetical protein [Acanthopleuribacter pedis]
MFFYQFKVNGIQPYIFATDRLREMVGASALVDQLTRRDLTRVIEALGLPIKDEDFARRAGGSFLVQIRARADAEALRDLWSLYVAHKVPGLGFCHALHEAEHYNAATRRALDAALHDGRNRHMPHLPAGSPLARRAPLTGDPAVVLKHGRLADAVCRAKQAAAVGGAFLEDKLNLSDADDLVFPLSFVPTDDHSSGDALINEHETDQYIAVIHIDGNGLGAVVENLNAALAENPAAFPHLPAAFSKAVEDATHRAARTACIDLFKSGLAASAGKPHKKVAPVRFLVLGGDDVTLVTRAADALAFTRCFQEAFAVETRAAFAKLSGLTLPDHLSAAAGVAFIKPKQPFHMAYHLAESLCQTAKKAAKAAAKAAAEEAAGEKTAKAAGLVADAVVAPATLAFHRITTAMIDDWEAVVAFEKTTRDGHWLTMQPYALDGAPDGPLPHLGDLYDLTDLLGRLGRGPVRELQKALYLGEQHTRKAQRRWRENLAKNAPDALAELEPLLRRLTRRTKDQKGCDDRLPLFDAQNRSPVADAVALAAVGDVKGRVS